MDIFSVLKQDLGEAMAWLSIWLNYPEGRQAQLAWARWSARWEIHARIEENFLFPFLRGEPDLRSRLEEAAEFHSRIRRRIRRIHSGDGDTCARNADAAALLDDIDRLMDMEEKRIFPRGMSVLSHEEAEELGMEVLDFMRGLRPAMADTH